MQVLKCTYNCILCLTETENVNAKYAVFSAFLPNTVHEVSTVTSGV